MDRRIPGEPLSPSTRNAEKDSLPARHLTVDPDRLPFPSPPVTWNSRLLEPQRPDLGSRRKEEGVLCDAAVVSRATEVRRHDDLRNSFSSQLFEVTGCERCLCRATTSRSERVVASRKRRPPQLERKPLRTITRGFESND